jgi:hypothetical protein
MITFDKNIFKDLKNMFYEIFHFKIFTAVG